MLPTPYYEQDGITIYNADCREILPHLPKVDLVLTDPPYGVGFTGKIPNDGRYATDGYKSFKDDDPQYIIERIIEAMQKSERAIITPGTRIMHMYPPWQDFGVFFVGGGVGMGKWGFCCSHPILYYGKRPRYKGMFPTSYSDGRPMPSCTEHPTAKPIEWMKRLVVVGSLKDDVILDPFMGSGTTLVAAKQLGRKAIGIEIEETYCQIAVKRLGQGVLPL
jgi:DNA modification methylase